MLFIVLWLFGVIGFISWPGKYFLHTIFNVMLCLTISRKSADLTRLHFPESERLLLVVNGRESKSNTGWNIILLCRVKYNITVPLPPPKTQTPLTVGVNRYRLLESWYRIFWESPVPGTDSFDWLAEPLLIHSFLLWRHTPSTVASTPLGGKFACMAALWVKQIRN